MTGKLFKWSTWRWGGIPALLAPTPGDVNEGVVCIRVMLPAYGGPSKKKLLKLRSWLLKQNRLIHTDGGDHTINPSVIELYMKYFTVYVQEDSEDHIIERMKVVFKEPLEVTWGRLEHYELESFFPQKYNGADDDDEDESVLQYNVPQPPSHSQLEQLIHQVDEDFDRF